MDTGELKKYIKGDRIIWAVLVALTCISLLIVYSSTGALAYRQAEGNTTHYILRQLIFQCVGYGAIILMLNYIPVKLYNKFANAAYVIAIAFVLLGLVFGRGGESTGRTLPLGFISFQPAEIAKVAIILWVARLLANNQKDPRLLRIAFVKIIIGIGIICLLISMANFSSAVLLFSTALIMMFVGRIPLKYLGLTMLAGIGFVMLIYFAAPLLPEKGNFGRIQTVRSRIDRHIHGDKSSVIGLTQDDFAKIAIHMGGITGVGAGKSKISNFMPAAYNDFIYSIIIEEYGLIGGIVVPLLYLIFLTRGGIIIRRCNRTFPTFLATGAVTIIILQAVINMAVSSGAIPVTGQPLPWVSWGGTSQVFTALTFGLLLSVSSETDQETQLEVENNFDPEGVLPDEDILLTKA
ncbi:MAG: FtsW/RodA/SpoVE family cell cycle protein [Bacteroidia bacterium]|nr:FtsW/RodA/SpoVE family cell cycle protein [Bacteroidia bacterium]